MPNGLTPFIQNVSLGDIKKGFHMDPGVNTMLIQICDPPGDFPTPLYKFRETHQFQFLDVEERDHVIDEEMRCSHAQAAELARLLQHALENRMNVIVHCHAGLCRSGAVVDVGVQLGFNDTEKFRAPNLLVKHRMMQALGWTYDSDEKPYEVHGKINEWGFIIPNNKYEGDI